VFQSLIGKVLQVSWGGAFESSRGQRFQSLIGKVLQHEEFPAPESWGMFQSLIGKVLPPHLRKELIKRALRFQSLIGKVLPAARRMFATHWSYWRMFQSLIGKVLHSRSLDLWFSEGERLVSIPYR